MEERLIAVFKEALEIEDHEVNLQDKFREYPEWDSIAYLSLIAALDEEFGFSTETAEFRKLITVNDLLTAIRESAEN